MKKNVVLVAVFIGLIFGTFLGSSIGFAEEGVSADQAVKDKKETKPSESDSDKAKVVEPEEEELGICKGGVCVKDDYEGDNDDSDSAKEKKESDLESL